MNKEIPINSTLSKYSIVIGVITSFINLVILILMIILFSNTIDNSIPTTNLNTNNINNEDLKSCPLCGSEVSIFYKEYNSNFTDASIECENCGLCLSVSGDTKSECRDILTEKWNNRFDGED